ncbi:cytochrome P450 [Fomitopsis betulina]|nr:cytochrome P450 [Fomitopsis betulina]
MLYVTDPAKLRIAFLSTILIILLYAGWLSYKRGRSRSCAYIRGPPAESFVTGHIVELTRQDQVGDLESEWINQYGWVWRIKHCLGRDVLFFADPKALHHIFKSGYSYSRTTDSKFISWMLMGESVLYTDHGQHARVRKAMDPAFSTARVREFSPIFQRLAKKLSSLWQQELAGGPILPSLNVCPWFSRMALDAICEAGFDFNCGALDNDMNEFVRVYKGMFQDSMMHPTTSSLLFRHFWPYIPESLLRGLVMLPVKQFKRMRHALYTINRLSQEFIEQRKSEKTQAESDPDQRRRDLMSILVEANASENPKHCLTDNEMIAQVATLLLAGHETSAGTLTMLFWELAKDVSYQQKMREEIATVRAHVVARGDVDFSVADLESMVHVNAAIKEIMRLHPVVYLIVRVADKDDVIPLSRPITTATGEIITEIPVAQGQHISVSSWGYNRLREVWGDDADIWNPSRFLSNSREKQTSVGVFANLLTFGGGNKACLGWRFTVLEIQAVLAVLLGNFEFTLPDDKPDIQRVPAGVTIPMIRSKTQLGSQMPLKITPVNPDPAQ